MATDRTKAPLETLQTLVNQVLVQTGKALRASRRDSQGNLPLLQVNLQPKIPETIDSFNFALTTLDREIIHAKSVLLRDINKLKGNPTELELPTDSNAPPLHKAVEAATKSPMVVDLDFLSKGPAVKEEAAADPALSAPDAMAANSVIVIDDDGPEISTVDDESIAIKAENADGAQLSAAATTAGVAQPKTEPFTLAGDSLDLGASDLNFTDIQFSLAPDNGPEAQADGDDNNNASFDLTTFGTGDIDPGSLDMLESSLANIPQAAPEAGGVEAAHAVGDVETKAEEGAQKKPVETAGGTAAFDGMFSGEGQTDGMDFDFSLGDAGMGDDTFDDLMNDRDNTFDAMEHGDFDATFFGLDKAEETTG